MKGRRIGIQITFSYFITNWYTLFFIYFYKIITVIYYYILKARMKLQIMMNLRRNGQKQIYEVDRGVIKIWLFIIISKVSYNQIVIIRTVPVFVGSLWLLGWTIFLDWAFSFLTQAIALVWIHYNLLHLVHRSLTLSAEYIEHQFAFMGWNMPLHSCVFLPRPLHRHNYAKKFFSHGLFELLVSHF